MPIGSSPSIETTILDISGNMLINIENNESTAMVALDLIAAFDTVNHRKFIKV